LCVFVFSVVGLAWFVRLDLFKGLLLFGIGSGATNLATSFIAAAFSFPSILISCGAKFINRFVQTGDFFFGERAIATFWEVT
jgi:hypothetical protein